MVAAELVVVAPRASSLSFALSLRSTFGRECVVEGLAVPARPEGGERAARRGGQPSRTVSASASTWYSEIPSSSEGRTSE